MKGLSSSSSGPGTEDDGVPRGLAHHSIHKEIVQEVTEELQQLQNRFDKLTEKINKLK